MATMGRELFGKPKSAGDNLLFLRVRWLLGLWVGVTVGLHWGLGWQDYAGAGLIGLFLLSQLALWKMPSRFLQGLQLHTAVFLLDLFFTMSALMLTGQVTPGLIAALFLSIFITALVKRMSMGLLVSAVCVLVYLAFKVQGPEGFAFTDLRQLLDLPFIVLSSLNVSIVVSESQFHQDITEALDADNQTLSKKLTSAATELKARIRFINSAFDAVPAPALVVDNEGLLRSFNTKAEELFGLKRMALLDRPLRSLTLLEPLRQAVRAINGEGAATAWLSNGKGQWFYAGVRCGTARDADGRLANMAVFVQPTDPPAETPTYESWLAAQQEAEQAREEAPGPRGPAEDAPATLREPQGGASVQAFPQSGEKQAAAALRAETETKKPGASVQDQSATKSGLVQRVIAASVDTDHPDKRENKY